VIEKGHALVKRDGGKWLYVVIPILAALLIGIGGAGSSPDKEELAKPCPKSN